MTLHSVSNRKIRLCAHLCEMAIIVTPPSLWIAVALGPVSGFGALLGALVGHFARPRRSVIGIVMGFRGGAIMAMLADTMMPEAFGLTGNLVALATTVGFICAFYVTKLF